MSQPEGIMKTKRPRPTHISEAERLFPCVRGAEKAKLRGKGGW